MQPGLSLQFWLIISAVLTIGIAAAVYILFRNRKKHKALQHYKYVSRFKPSQVNYSVFVAGDMGALTYNDPVAQVLLQELSTAGENGLFLILGDNIYPRGMPPEGHYDRKRAEKRLNIQLDMIKVFKGKSVMLSGNHDWNKGRSGGFEAVLRQQQYTDNYIGRNDVFLPRDGCPGPLEFQLKENITLVVINTQWWVQLGKRPHGKKDGCCVENETEFFQKLKEILQRNKDKHLLIAAHHPLYSNALHGGKFTYKQHIFPLTALHKKFYFPLPLLGSLYPLYRKYYGAREDISHPRYKRMRRKLLRILKHFPGIVYMAGHDHNLQHIIKHHNHYLISGSGSKVAYVKKYGKAKFAAPVHGYFKISYLKNNEVWLEAFTPRQNPETRAFFAELIYGSRLK